jgi:hypothetical protein
MVLRGLRRFVGQHHEHIQVARDFLFRNLRQILSLFRIEVNMPFRDGSLQYYAFTAATAAPGSAALLSEFCWYTLRARFGSIIFDFDI